MYLIRDSNFAGDSRSRQYLTAIEFYMLPKSCITDSTTSLLPLCQIANCVKQMTDKCLRREVREKKIVCLVREKPKRSKSRTSPEYGIHSGEKLAS